MLEESFRRIAKDLKAEPDHEEVFFVISDLRKPEELKLTNLIGIEKE